MSLDLPATGPILALPGRRFWCCALIAALMHAGLFQLLRSQGAHQSGRDTSLRLASLQFRALHLNRLTPTLTSVPKLARTEIETSDDERLVNLQAVHMPLAAAAPADSKLAGAAAISAGAQAPADSGLILSWSRKLRVRAPDVAMPDQGDSLTLRLWMELDQSGEILALQASDPRPQAQAFVAAIADSVTQAGLTAQDGRGQGSKAQLCLTVRFQTAAPTDLDIEALAPRPPQRTRCLKSAAGVIRPQAQ